jgi:hypothetical protein
MNAFTFKRIIHNKEEKQKMKLKSKFEVIFSYLQYEQLSYL